MRIYSIAFIALAFALSACSGEQQKELSETGQPGSNIRQLPVPGKEFFMKYGTGAETDIRYLQTYFEEIGQREYDNKDSANWSQKFKGGISVVSKGARSGINTRITFPDYDKPEVLKFMQWFYTYSENGWNKDQTEYSPIEEGAGCYYKIQKDSLDHYVIDCYCGC